MKRIALLFAVLAVFCTGTVVAQDVITDSQEYQEMMRYKDLYDQAYQDGDYEKALEYAREVKTWSEKVNELADAELERRRNAVSDDPNAPIDGETEEERWLRVRETATARMEALDAELLDLHADSIAPRDYAAFSAGRDELMALLEDQSRLYEAQELYNNLVEEAEALKNTVRDQTDLVRARQQQAADAIDAARQSESVAALSAEELSQAEQRYQEAETAQSEYRYGDAIDGFSAALYYARGALMLTEQNDAVAETDAQLADSQKTVETNSRVLVSDGNGKVHLSEGWSGDAYLEEHPLVELSVTLIPYEPGVTEPRFKSADETKTVEAPETGESESSIETAIRLWKMGVNARNAGDLPLAREYFAQSVVFAETYKNEAPTAFYKVLKNDNLWFIAKKVYGNPFFWPMIFEANDEIIENPALIFPGQEFLIPNP